jgi:hypothetical protein
VAGKARFDVNSGKSVFLPSLILTAAEQWELILRSGLHLEGLEHVYVRELPDLRSPKIFSNLNDDDPVLDIYRVRK